jgi:glutamate-1-semialdehyde 2,1-aminomutase
MDRFEKSKEMQQEARRYLAGGVSSNFRYNDISGPLCILGGEGPYIFDIDGNKLLDYALGYGPLILGHGPERVIAAVAETLGGGQLVVGLHPSELELARRLVDILPCAELVRFAVSGTEADQMAIRLARAYTGRFKVIKFEGMYHGWADNIFVSVQPSLNEAGPREAPTPVLTSLGQAPGIAGDLIVLPWNDSEALSAAVEQAADEVAAIVMEPILCNNGVIEPQPGYLEAARALCDRHGIVLVFDEVITGFRVGLGGAQARYGVTPDLAVLWPAAFP